MLLFSFDLENLSEHFNVSLEICSGFPKFLVIAALLHHVVSESEEDLFDAEMSSIISKSLPSESDALLVAVLSLL